VRRNTCNVCRGTLGALHEALGSAPAAGDASNLPPPGAARLPGVVYRCGECDFDLCYCCALAEDQEPAAAAWLAGAAAAALPAALRAPAVATRGHGHVLLRYAGGWRGASETRYCNECRRHTAESFREVAPGAPPERVVMHACLDCDYDLCVACTSRALPPAAATAAAAPAAPPLGANVVDATRTIVTFGRWRLLYTGDRRYLYAWTEGGGVRVIEFCCASIGWYRFATGYSSEAQRIVYSSTHVSNQDLLHGWQSVMSSSLPRTADLASAAAAAAAHVATALSSQNIVVAIEEVGGSRAVCVSLGDNDVVRLFANGASEARSSGSRVDAVSFGPL